MISNFASKRSVFAILSMLCFTAFINAQNTSIDKKMGEEGKTAVETTMGLYDDPAKIKILNELGNNLTNHLDNKLFDYQFFIVDMGEPNAFALPGGYIYFTRGILALTNYEDELAGVMGHEIIHSNNRHSIQQMKKGILPGLLLSLPQALTTAVLGENAGKLFSPLTKGSKAITASHSRKDENEADKLGIALAAQSGYNPASLGHILSNLNQSIEMFTGEKEQPSYFSDHPLTADRIDKISKESAQLKTAVLPKLFKDKKEYLHFIDGIVVGPNPKQGVFQNDWFIHPHLNFKFNVPNNWMKENTATAVAAIDTTGSAMVMLEIENKYKTATEAAIGNATEIQKKTGKTIDVVSKKINGYVAKTVAFETKDNNKVVKCAIYWIEYNNMVFKLTGASTPELEKTVTQSIESFNATTPADIQSITVKKLKVVECLKGDDLQTLSAREKNVISADLTAAINGIGKDKALTEGELLKIVVEVPYLK